MSKQKTSIVVPCISSMQDDLINKLLPSIVHQTVLPDELVIAISQGDISEEKRQKIREVLKDVDVIFLSTPQTMFAGGNRMRGVMASSGSVILFMDADDKMQNQRVEIIKSCFEKHPKTLGILHQHRTNCQNTDYRMDNFQRIINNHPTFLSPEMVWKKYCFYRDLHKTEDPYSFPFYKEQLHMGHLCVRREVFHYCVFDTSAQRGQDSCFVRDIIKRFKGSDQGLSILNLPLTSYQKNPKGPRRKTGLERHPGPWIQP
jgi:glycosyltransferase involved in cell wall biosynthesis